MPPSRRRRGLPPRPPHVKLEETPTRREAGRRPRTRGFGYWLRRPEPSIALGIWFVLLFLACGVVLRDIVPVLVGSLPAVVIVATVWLTRDVWRANAERWRKRRDGAF